MMQSPLKNFPSIYTQNVIWGDMDMLGHVNNVIYYRYMESARIDYFKEMNLFGHGIMMVISKSNCQYLSSVVYPDQLYIGACVEEIRNSAVRMSYTLFSEQQKKVVAIGEAVMVCLDENTQQKTNIPSKLKQLILDFEQSVGNIPICS